jgi:transposase
MTNPSLLPSEPAWAAFAAIDWGSKAHSWALLPAAGGPLESAKLDNTPEAVDRWATQLRTRFPDAPIALALEQKRGAVIYMLSKYDYFALFSVPPSMSAFYRRAFVPSGAKSDPGDAALLLDLLLHHRERLRPRLTETPATRLLQFLVEQRRQLVQQKVRFVEQFTASVEQYFPQLRSWFHRLDSPVVEALLARWPNLVALQHSHPGTLRRFLLAHNCRKEELIRTRIEAVYAAVPATTDPVVLEAARYRTVACLKLIGDLRQQIAMLEKRIGAVTADHPDAPIFASFPGAGAATVPRLIAAFGTCRDNWTCAEDLQRFSGIAPVHKSSGNSTIVVMRRACPKFLRQTFHEFAGQSIPHSPWAKAYYRHQRSDLKKPHHAAVRALAFRWIRILYRCWKDREPYNEQILLASQQRRNALFGCNNPVETRVRWETVAGFKKLTTDSN